MKHARFPLLAAALFAALLALPAFGQTLLDPSALTKYVDPLPIPAVIAASETVGGVPVYHVSMTEFEQQLHSQMQPTKVWGYNGTYPGPTFVVRSGQLVKVEWANNLPAHHLLKVDTMVHGAMGVPESRSVVHLHGAEAASMYDGGPMDWYAPGNSQVYEYDNTQDATTLWYHDHSMGITRLNAYAGLEGFYIIRDDVEDALNLPKGAQEIGLALQDRAFLSNSQLYYPDMWTMTFFGNFSVVNGKVWPYLEVEPRKYRFHMLGGSNGRFFDLKLLAADASGHVAADSAAGPVFNVIGSDQGLLERPVKLNDPSDPMSGRLLIGPGERYDVVIDFSGLQGKNYLLHNDAPAPYSGMSGYMYGGMGGGRMYGGGMGGGMYGGGMGGGMYGGMGGGMGMGMGYMWSLPEIMLFRVKDTTVVDSSSMPDYLRPTPRIPESQAIETRDVTLEMAMMGGMGGGMYGGYYDSMYGGYYGGMGGGMRGGMGGGMRGGMGGGMGGGMYGGMGGGMGMGMGMSMSSMMKMTLNGMMFEDPIMEMPIHGTTEIWRMINLTCVAHPMHLHNCRFQVLDRQPFNMMSYRTTRSLTFTGPAEAPGPEESGWKDTYLCPPGYVSRLIVKWDSPHTGVYDYHCHILEHEDNDMMRPFEIMADSMGGMRVASAQKTLSKVLPNPFWTWTRVMYTLPADASVDLRILDATGRTVRSLTKAQNRKGSYSVIWDGTADSGDHVAAGVYFVRLKAGDRLETRRTTVMR